MSDHPDLIAVAEPCPVCDGIGRTKTEALHGSGWVWPTCLTCNGDGSRYVVTDRTVAEAVSDAVKAEISVLHDLVRFMNMLRDKGEGDGWVEMDFTGDFPVTTFHDAWPEPFPALLASIVSEQPVGWRPTDVVAEAVNAERQRILAAFREVVERSWGTSKWVEIAAIVNDARTAIGEKPA